MAIEQRRIQLAQTIDHDKPKESKRKRFFGRHKTAGVSGSKLGANAAPKEIALTISLPGLPKLPKISSPASIYRKVSKVGKKRLMIGGGVLLAAVAGLGAYSLVIHRESNGNGSSAANVLSTNNQRNERPSYHTLLPKGKTIEQLGGWGRVSPPDKDPVFAFADSMDGVQLNVSEQQLPESFKKDVNGEVSKLAAQFSATQQVRAGDVLVYVGTSYKGPQSAILTKDGLLILIRSATKLTDQQWATYVSALQ